MSYNQKPPGPSGSGMGGGPPNGPNNIPQAAKAFAGIQQQMQNLVHGQNSIPQAELNAYIQQQQRLQLIKQQQFLQFQQQMKQQQQQHQQLQHQHHNMAGGGGVAPGPVGSVPGVGGVSGPGNGGAGGSGEPLALTRTAGAAELLNKTYQQQANGNPAANPAFNTLQQTLQGLPTNFVQQLQAQLQAQYQLQAKQMQHHGGGMAQHGHDQQQPVQGVPPPPPTTTAMSHQQQQQQKHQNQYQQQQQQNALSRYLTAAAAQAAVASGNKISSATPPPPPPLTNQMKPPNLPLNTQITPVAAANVGGANLSAGPHHKMSTGSANTGPVKHQAPPPSISLTPSKPSSSGPSVAHHQNKFTPPTNSGAKGGHMGHSQNLPKSTHGATTHTVTSNTTCPAKSGTPADVTVAALKSPQSTPVQLTKQMPPTATTAAMGNKTLASATTTTTGATSSMVSSNKTITTSTTALTPSATTSFTTTPGIGTNTTTTTSGAVNAPPTKSSVTNKPTADEGAAAKLPFKSTNAEKEAVNTPSNDGNKPTVTDSNAASNSDNTKNETDKCKDQNVDASAVVYKKSSVPVDESNDSADKSNNDLKSNLVTTTTNISLTSTTTPATTTAALPLESKTDEDKTDVSAKSNKTDNHEVKENEKKLVDANKTIGEKDKIPTIDENKSTPVTTTVQETPKQSESPITDDKIKVDDGLTQNKNSQNEKKLDLKDEGSDKEKDKKPKTNKLSTKTDQVDSVSSKDVQNASIETDKSNTAVETKTTTTTTQIAAPKTSEKKDAAITNNSLETNNKKEKTDSGPPKTEENKPITPVGEPESTKTPIATEIKKEVASKKEEKEESVKPIIPTEKAEITSSAKSTSAPPAATNKTKAEDSVKDSVESTQKELVTVAAATPVKKVGRHAKGAKNKSAAVSIPVEKKTPEAQQDKPAATSARVKRKLKADNSVTSESAPSTPRDDDLDRKSKRHRLKTILYQSPLPELAYITKLSASEASNSPKPMSNEDRLIVFYKNEYMAVRNAEGTFYLCQTMQNVYRTSPRISIRWLSEDDKDSNVFIPDFYDHTDIECVLTTVELKRIDKGHLRLPKGERNRIESILKKAIDVEKGIVPRPELTEENPDGLDISLFKDESQIEKKSALAEGSESLTPSTAAGRKSRRGTTAATTSLSARKSTSISATPSTSAGSKHKRGAGSVASTSASSRKTLTKKRKLIKRKKKIENSGDEDDDETSDDYESDTEYKPTQKRASLITTSAGSKSTPRAQRSPLAKARAASPITPTTPRSSKNVPQKTTPTPSTSKATRGERAAKRKSLTDAGSSEDSSSPVKKPTTTSNNKSKGTLKKSKH